MSVEAERIEARVPAAEAEPVVAGAPVDRAISDGRSRVYGAASRERPQDRPGGGIEAVHLVAGARHRRGVDDAVGDRHWCKVERTLRVRRLPEDLSGRRIERGPRTAGRAFS